MHDETTAIHFGYEGESTRAVAVPIYQTVAHEFENAEQAGAIFDLEQPGFHYNRINNPTVEVLENRINALEGGAGAMAVASGMAAVRYALRNLSQAGSNIVAVPQLYGASYTLLAHVLPEEGIEVRFGDSADPYSIERLIDDRTAAVFCESIGNPAGNIVDLPLLAESAHAKGVPVVVDNTVATPVLMKPVRYGADVVVHSLTKFIGGHGTTLGGLIVDGGRFDWGADPVRHPMFCRPEPAFHGVEYCRDFPHNPYITRCRTVGLRNSGATLAPLNAFLLLQGLETLHLRLDRHGYNTSAVAQYLSADDRITWVSWSGLPEHPDHEVGQRLCGGRHPSVLTFGARGGFQAALEFFNNVKLFKRLVNLGDAKSLVSHPASTTHRQLTSGDLQRVGVTEDMIRLSIGIEHIDDLLEDIDQALGR